MFLFLNRLLRLCVITGYLAAAWGIWMQRERARPLWDQYELWRDVNWTSPAPLPRLEVKVVRLLSESIVQVQSADGRPWNLALEAVEVGGLPVSKETQLWSSQNRTNLALQWTGQPASWAWTQTNANRTGRGFLYLAGTNVLEGVLREGRLGFKPELARVLPIKEQLRLRQANRAGQAAGAGRWEWLRDPNADPATGTANPAPKP
jgi:hypothetical protein